MIRINQDELMKVIPKTRADSQGKDPGRHEERELKK